MGIPLWSFVIAYVDDTQIDWLLCRNKVIGDVIENRGCVFAFQIPEWLMAEGQNQALLNSMTEACESNAKDLTIDDDDNYGFSRDWIKVPVNYSQMIKSKYAYYERKEPFSYQRLLWFNMNWDLKRVHLEVFKYL